MKRILSVCILLAMTVGAAADSRAEGSQRIELSSISELNRAGIISLAQTHKLTEKAKKKIEADYNACIAKCGTGGGLGTASKEMR